ncbi:class I adenylate-forming enzyme family protein [Cucumibacter marinus]|uniref:class I adenylate-forming enzyme family protein n=1 Tax=Cucumibacter marinus TaxID=1121252 RepID=UPI0004170E73|nr:class I adenylate-forming enzyme family protein [Cucumibacter marinus]
MNTIFDDILGRTDGLDAEAVCGSDPASYRTLLDRAAELAATLRKAGAKKGDRVGAMLAIGLDNFALALACGGAGFVLVPIHPRARPADRDHVLSNADCRFYAGPAGRGHNLIADYGDWVIESARPGDRFDPPQGTAAILHTSGTTGKPKGVLLTHEAVSANVRAVSAYLGLNRDSRTVVFMPPHYSSGFNQILSALWSGGAILPWGAGMFDVPGLIEAIRQYRIGRISGNPMLFTRIAEVAEELGVTLDPLEVVQSTGQALTMDLVERLRRNCPNARVVGIYGFTENSPRVSYRWMDGQVHAPDGILPVGRAIEGTTVRVVRPDGADAAPDELGEIIVSGTSLMSGYVRDGVLDRRDVENGWFKSGDTGFIDKAGELHFRNRADFVIICNNERVSPEEVEVALGGVAGVLDVGVAGIEDAVHGHVPIALVVCEGALSDVVPGLRRQASQRLMRTKHPRHYVKVEAIPRSDFGKIDRASLARLVDRLDPAEFS